MGVAIDGRHAQFRLSRGAKTLSSGRLQVWGSSRAAPATTAGVFFDEIKSSQQSLIVRDKATIAQCVKYVRAGLDLYGDNFAGVRLILLAARQASVWVDRHENFHPLAGSPLAVDLMRGEN